MTPWWKQAIGYQIYPRSFLDSDGDGMGDLNGVTRGLDHLSELGVDLLWLSPVYRSPMADNGYDISNYHQVDPSFGELSDLDRLIENARQRGIRVIMDLVVNHTSDEHPWFLASRDPRNPERDWYHWRPGRADGPPNNWASRFSGPAWQYDPASGEYYLHLFTARQPDLNWENPDLRSAVQQMMRWWIDRGVSGFRMDVINFISKTPGLPDVETAGQSPWSEAEQFYANGPRLLEHLQELRAKTVGESQDLVLIGETPAITAEQAQILTDPANHALDMVFQFEHVQIDHGAHRWDAREFELPRLKHSFAHWQDTMAERGWNSLYLNNHDQPRVISRWGDRNRPELSAKLFATLLHAHRGTPFVYQGEEIGMRNADFTELSQYRDVQSLNFAAEACEELGWTSARVLQTLGRLSRENARTPMQWRSGPGSGFSQGTPWLQIPDHDQNETVADQRDDPTSVLHHYRQLITLRRRLPIMVHGWFRLRDPDHPALWIVERGLAEERLLACGNLSAEPTAVPSALLADHSTSQVLLSSHQRGSLPAQLQPWESLLLRR